MRSMLSRTSVLPGGTYSVFQYHVFRFTLLSRHKSVLRIKCQMRCTAFPIGSDDGRTPFVALADDLEEQVSAGLVDREIAQFVEDQDTGSNVTTQFLLEPAGGLCSGEGVDHVDGAGEQHAVVMVACSEPHGNGEVALAQADPADEDDVGGLVDELQTEEVLDLQTVEFLGPVPLELVEGLTHRESGEAHAPFDGAVLSAVRFALDEAVEEGDGITLFLGGIAGEFGVVLADEGQFQVVEVGVEGIEVVGVRDGAFGGHEGGSPGPSGRWVEVEVVEFEVGFREFEFEEI